MHTHGVHFLTDYYALLRLERFTPDAEAIERAYAKFKRRHSPKNRKGKRTKEQAAHLLRHAALAHDTLTDDRKKGTYDELLANWQGPISQDGMPVISVTDPLWQAPVLKQDAAMSHDEQLAYAQQQTGDDPKLLEHLWRGRLLSGRAALLYFEAATRHLDYWLCHIEQRLYADGIMNVTFVAGRLTAQLASIMTRRQAQATAAWRELNDRVDKGAVKVLPTSGATLASKQKEAEAALAATTEAVLAFAVQHDRMLDQLAPPLYTPRQEVFHPDVVVVLSMGDQTMRCAYHLSDAEPQVSECLTEEELEGVDAPKKAEQLIAAGWNIIYAYHPPGIDAMAFVASTLQAHREKMGRQHQP